jgi:hypothetical protein
MSGGRTKIIGVAGLIAFVTALNYLLLLRRRCLT